MIDECLQLLCEYEGRLPSKVSDDDLDTRSSVIALRRAFEFGQETLLGMRLLMDAGRLPILACTLCRPFYELSYRCLWASRTPSGWLRMMRYYVEEDKSWAKAAKTVPDLMEIAESRLEEDAELLCGLRVEPMPRPFNTILRMVDEKDRAAKLISPRASHASLNYAAVYRILCRTAHAHIAAIGPADIVEYRAHAAWAALGGVWALLQAWCHTVPKDREQQFDSLTKRITTIMEKSAKQHA